VRILGAPLLVFALVLAGCGRGGGTPKTHPAQGQIVDKKGNPFAGGGTIELRLNKGDFLVRGVIKDDGTFTLFTTTSTGKTDGAPEGEYAVAIIPHVNPKGEVKALTLTKKYKIEPKSNELRIVLE
jgi:hypothetical protein